MKQINLKYEGYLTETKLYDIICDFCQQVGIEKPISQFKIGKFKIDVVIKINDTMFAIEFDGYRHFNNTITMKRDIEKNIQWANQYNTQIIRIPYYIQLTEEVFNYLFEEIIEILFIKVDIKQDYLHGFIDKMALLPCDFNELGQKLFIKNMRRYPKNVEKEIKKSLNDKNKNNLFTNTFVELFLL
jgi:hypothetical protein